MATLPAGHAHAARRRRAGPPLRAAARRHGGVYGAPGPAARRRGQQRRRRAVRRCAAGQRGAAVTALLLAPDRVHAGGLAALRAAGGRVSCRAPAAVPTWCSTASSASAARGGLREPAAAVVAALAGLRGRAGERPPVVAVDVPSGVEVDTGDVPGRRRRHGDGRRHRHLRLPQAGPGGRPGRAHAGQVELVDIGLRPVAARHARAAGAASATTCGAGGRGSGAAAEKYGRGRGRGRRPARPTYPGAAVLSVGGALAGPAGWSATRAAPRPRCCARHPSVIADRTGWHRAGGCRPGSAAPGWAPTSAAATELRSRARRAGAGGARRGRAHAAGRTGRWRERLRRAARADRG